MKAVTGKEMGSIDKYSIEQIGIPGIVLMENAALKVVKHIEAYIDKNKGPVVIVAGKGNNAGDAFAAARLLVTRGITVTVFYLFEKDSIKGDARTNFNILERIGADMVFLGIDSLNEEFNNQICRAQMVVDGIFGTGFRGDIEGLAAEVIHRINEYSQYTLAIDIASGIDSATGRTAGTCIMAHKTVTFELPKTGQLVYPGVQFTGELAIEGIGMPAEAINSIEINTNLLEKDFIKKCIPIRKAEFNKGNCGKVAVITGAVGMAGAGCLTSRAALKSGSGLVYIAGPKNLLNIYQSVVPEAVVIKLEESPEYIEEASTDHIINLIKKCDVAAVGPGLSARSDIYNIVDSIAKQTDKPLVLDADALNAVSRNPEIFKSFKNEVVITPHPGEMARLTGLETSYIQQNRIEVCKKYAKLWGLVVVLKGARTVIADMNGSVFINPTGNPGMATAGSGDTLTGIIASLIGQGAKALEAACSGVYLHGVAGDMAAGEKGEYGITAMDIAEKIPFAINNTI